MDNLIRTDTVFGKRVNLVGNISADLVLESLGKVYIKSRNKAQTLEEFITSLIGDPNMSVSRTLVVEGIEDLDTSGLKEGTFVFDKLSNILYLFLDGELLELINVAPEGTGYVKRSGDTMTGRLAIYVKNGPPLYVNSTDLIKNLNANYLLGETADNFTRRHRNEYITGKWKFKNSIEFENNIKVYRDIILNGSVGSESFAGGFGGYGWRMDADTNTLTVDNLVVRKLMRVYELVVNKISATNGALWISNSGKVVSCLKLPIVTQSLLSNVTERNKLIFDFRKDFCFVLLPDDYAVTRFDLLTDLLVASGNNVSEQAPEMFTAATLLNAKVILIKEPNADYTSENFKGSTNDNYASGSLFDLDFLFNVKFPFVPRNKYSEYLSKLSEYESYSDRIKYYEGLISTEKAKPEEQQRTLLIADWETTVATLQSLQETAKSNIPTVSTLIVNNLTFFKYYGEGDFYTVVFDDDDLPLFKPGDILRCLKWTYSGIKYYDAVVCGLFDKFCILRLSVSILDKVTEIHYDDSLEPQVRYVNENYNKSLYERCSKYINPVEIADDDPILQGLTDEQKEKVREERRKEQMLGGVEEKDGLVQMGNLWDVQRLNAMYLTSVDDCSPYMEVICGCNRPDYSVIYKVPVWKTVKLHVSEIPTHIDGDSGPSILFPPPYTLYIVPVPYTGTYYILNGPSKAEYCYFKLVLTDSSDLDGYIKTYTKYFLSTNMNLPVSLPQLPLGYTGSVELVNYLRTTPYWDASNQSDCTSLGEAFEYYNFLMEDGGYILQEDGSKILTENNKLLLLITSTKTTKARFGNLDGILDEVFPMNKQPYGYGLYGLNVFLTGEFYLNNGQSVAEIGEDAIAFAIASADALNKNQGLLNERLQLVDTYVKNNFYTKGTLDTAGIRIVGIDTDNNGKNDDNVIAMWANHIVIVTKLEEFDTNTYTALFENGKFNANFIVVNDIHSKLGVDGTQRYYYNDIEVFKTDYKEEGDTMIYGTWYYYLDENQEPVYVDNDKVIVGEYGTYGWHIKADGSGYLAQRNISWDTDGLLWLAGGIALTPPQGLLLYDSQGNNTFSIIGNNNTFSSFFSSNSTYKRYNQILRKINYNTDSTNGYLLGFTILNAEPRGFKEINFLWLSYSLESSDLPNSNNYTLTYRVTYSDNTVSSLYGGFNDSIYFAEVTDEHIKKIEVGLQLSVVGNLDIYFTGVLNISGSLLSSQIGSNFITFNYFDDGSNLKSLWFGNEGLFLGGVRQSTGMFMDSSGINIVDLYGVYNESQYKQRMITNSYYDLTQTAHNASGLDTVGRLGDGRYYTNMNIKNIISNTTGVVRITGTDTLLLETSSGGRIRGYSTYNGYKYIDVYPTSLRENIIIVEKFFDSGNSHDNGYAIILNSVWDETPIGLKVLIIVGNQGGSAKNVEHLDPVRVAAHGYIRLYAYTEGALTFDHTNYASHFSDIVAEKTGRKDAHTRSVYLNDEPMWFIYLGNNIWKLMDLKYQW